LPQRIVDARRKSPLLLPELSFHPRAERQESLMFGLGTEAHHTFDAGTVVPAAVKITISPAAGKCSM
jgi:hypothetical protein